MKKLFFLLTHLGAAAGGFALGIYLLPILTQPPGPSAAEMATAIGQQLYQGEFRRELKGSDFFHWGQGAVSVGRQSIALSGSLAPGPDYKLYLSPEFVQDEAQFGEWKEKMVRVGDVKTFDGFVVPVPAGINPDDFNTVVIWCESFGEFISAARYR